jgi:hypothetical protein
MDVFEAHRPHLHAVATRLLGSRAEADAALLVVLQTLPAAAGFVATEAGVPVAVLAFTIVDGRITEIDVLDGPPRIDGLGLERFAADSP